MTRRVTDIVDDGEVLGNVGGVATSVPIPVDSVNGQIGAVVLDAADVGAATTAQGSAADSAVQPGDNVNTLGSGAATDGQVPMADGAGGVAWETPISGTSAPLLHVRDEKAAGTQGGAFTSGSWQTRTLNTVKTNDISGASLATNQITLPAGVYEVDGSIPAFRVESHQSQLYDVTGAATLVVGSGDYSDTETTGGSGNRSVLRGRFTLAVTSVLEVRHRCVTTNATAGLGIAANLGVVEVYADVMFRKLS